MKTGYCGTVKESHPSVPTHGGSGQAPDGDLTGAGWNLKTRSLDSEGCWPDDVQYFRAKIVSPGGSGALGCRLSGLHLSPYRREASESMEQTVLDCCISVSALSQLTHI